MVLAFAPSSTLEMTEICGESAKERNGFRDGDGDSSDIRVKLLLLSHILHEPVTMSSSDFSGYPNEREGPETHHAPKAGTNPVVKGLPLAIAGSL